MMKRPLSATISAVALLLAAASWPGDIGAAEEQPVANVGQTSAEQPIDGEALAEDPAHGMGEGDDALGGGVATHTLEGERGYAELEGEERQAAHVDPALGDWTIEALLGAAIVNGDGEAIGGIEDLIVDEDDRIRKAVIAIDGEAATFVMVPIETLGRAAGDAAETLVVADALEVDDHEPVRRQDERWLPKGE
jgi:hypothetical protein